jgi:sulfonate transport system ATP-binding protein
MTAPALLDLHVRRKAFGDRIVLQDVALSLHQGEVVALVGASGCGKSTLLRIAAGLDRGFEGHVRLAGLPVAGPTREIRFVFQEPRLFPWLTVASNVAFDLGGPQADPARVEALLSEVGLEGLGTRLPKQLSGGQAQRVAIARGLFVQPHVLLLDEPFSAVDAFTRLKLQDLLLRVAHAHGITVLLVTHDIDEAVHLADRVIVLEADPGRIRAEVAVPQPRPRDRDLPESATAIATVRHALQVAHAL